MSVQGSRNGAFYLHKSSVGKNTNIGKSNWALNLVQHHVLATDNT